MNRFSSLLILFIVFALLSPVAALAQDAPTAPAPADPLWAVVALVAIIVLGVVNGSALYVLTRINSNSQILRAAEDAYNRASKENQQLILLVQDALEMAERLSKDVVPKELMPPDLAKAIDLAEDTLREITDDIPIDEKG